MDGPNYKEMYLTMVRASEEAINGLVIAQQKCEEMYIGTPEGKPETEKEGH